MLCLPSRMLESLFQIFMEVGLVYVLSASPRLGVLMLRSFTASHMLFFVDLLQPL